MPVRALMSSVICWRREASGDAALSLAARVAFVDRKEMAQFRRVAIGREKSRG
jgi:hypothetical protein